MTILVLDVHLGAEDGQQIGIVVAYHKNAIILSVASNVASA